MSTDNLDLDALRGLLDAATPGPWEWVDPDTDLPCMPDAPCEAGDHDDCAYRFSLRTVAEYPTRSVGMLPKFIIHSAEEFHEVEVAPGEWKHPDAALIVALVNAAPALIAAARERDALRANAESMAERYPCDGGCSYGDGPDETCSAHGRPPAEVWQIVNDVAEQRDRALCERDELTSAMRALHRHVPVYPVRDDGELDTRYPEDGYCEGCGGDWPCRTAEALDAATRDGGAE